MASNNLSRRQFIKTSAAATSGIILAPYLNCGKLGVETPMKRLFGRLNFNVTSFGLGGQASIQWTPEDVDPVKIILKAFQLGVNYFDTSNLYGPSQTNYGKAFQQLDLIPGRTGYNEKKRRSIFLTSKTHLRVAKGPNQIEGVGNWSNGSEGSQTVDDVKRSLSQIFGDGQGNYPPGAWLDMVLIHSLSRPREVDVLYEGLENTDPKAELIGALAALRDLRDGTNLSGLNPREEKLIHHVGFSGHFSPPLMIDLIQRDQDNLLEGMLVAINSNDRLKFNMQYNVIPVAAAKNMGIIAMKVFADGAMYTKEAVWSGNPTHVVRTVGNTDLPSRPLVEYALTTPGIATAIIGIGQIDDNPDNCQLSQNLSAAQILPDGFTSNDRKNVEAMTRAIKDGNTNYFQTDAEPLSAPRELTVAQENADTKRTVILSWQTAYAGDEPLQHYEIFRDNIKVGQVKHQPQTTKKPFVFQDKPADPQGHAYKVVSVDAVGRTAATDEIVIEAVG